jgi:hypothetical protein
MEFRSEMERVMNSATLWHRTSKLACLVVYPLLTAACGASAPDDESLGRLSSEITQPDGVDTSSTSGELGAVGRFTFPQCTGTLVARDLVLTAAHCMACEALPTPSSAHGHSFKAGPFTDSVQIPLSGWTPDPNSNSCGWFNDGGIPDWGIPTDLAVARLHDPVASAQSEDVMPVFLDDPKYLDKTSAFTVGMSTGFRQYKTVHPSGNWSESFSSGPFNHGDSGGPLFMTDTRTGMPALVGVISAQLDGTGYWASTIGKADFLANALGIPANVALKDVAVMGSQVKLNDRVRVARTVLSPASITVAGESVELGADAVLEGSIASRSNVTLRSRAKVQGNILTRGVVNSQQGATVAGTTTDGTYVKLPVVPASGPPISVFTGAQDVWINSGQPCQPLSSGIYGEVHLSPQTHCSMKAGVYFIRNLYVDADATLDVGQDSTLPTIISTGTFLLRGQMVSSVNNFVMVVWGEQSTTFLNTSFSGTLIALHGSLVLAPATHFGAFFGRSIEVHQGATIAQVPTVTSVFD